jgi:hypothetical protein
MMSKKNEYRETQNLIKSLRAEKNVPQGIEQKIIDHIVEQKFQIMALEKEILERKLKSEKGGD